MADDEPELPHPGPAPRSVGLSRFLGMCPLSLTIAVVGNLPLVIGLSIWALFAPSRHSIGLLILPLVVLPIVLALLWRLKSLLKHGATVEAIVTSVEASREMAGGAIATFRYSIDGKEYEQRHMFNAYDRTRARWFVPGAQIWAVVSSKNPARAIPWV